MARAWYIYNGPPGASPESTVGNYSLAPFFPACAGGPNLCAIYGLYGGAQPHPNTFSRNLKSYLITAKTNQSYFPNGAGQKPYAYTRV